VNPLVGGGCSVAPPPQLRESNAAATTNSEMANGRDANGMLLRMDFVGMAM